MTAAARVKKRDTGIMVRTAVRTVLIYVLLLIIAAATVGPFLVMVSASLRPNFSYMTFPISLIPENPGIDNYIRLFSQTAIGRWIFNSVFVASTVTVLELVTCSLAGYAFARGSFPGRDVIFWIFMGTLMVPSTVTIVPLFLILSRLKWVDTYAALIIPAATSIFGTFLLRQFFLTIPTDYDQAALIDGASLFQIYRMVILPLAKPALATLATLTFLGQWNAFLYPLIVTTKSSMRILTVGLATMVVQEGGAGVQMAGATLTFTPTFLIFLFMQRYVVQGITLSGVKG
ncbi:MAG: carbohydrate ABC transporter permease [Anaerolineae bacterium]|nr:carbohydrate ABC transporter permease [Anaerolineae bacterium]